MKELLRGVYDLHVHTAPDVSPRKCDDLELARRLEKTGRSEEHTSELQSQR